MIIRKSSIITMLLLLPFTILDFLNIPSIELIWTYVALFVACILLLRKKYCSFGGECIFVIQMIYAVFQLYTTVSAGGSTDVDLINIRYTAIRFAVLIVVIGVYRKEAIRVLNKLLTICYIWNFIDIILRALTLGTLFLSADEYYFLGYRYVFCTFMILGLSVSYYCKEFSTLERIIYKLNYILTWITALTAGPSTLLGGLIVYTALLYFSDQKINGKLMHFKLRGVALTVLAIGLNVGIVFFNIQESFAVLINSILHRDVTFTGRTTIWETSIYAFMNGNKLTGLGNSLAFGYNGWGNLGWEEQKYSAHNQILTILTNTGIVGLIIEGAFFGITLYRIVKMENLNNKKVFLACYISMLIMSISTQLIPFYYIVFFSLIVMYVAAEEKNLREIKENKIV